ncbi:apolipoprotein N-acyltransferase, partial [Chlamydia psittaci]|nr:apolipoprotein N-acyltransferase [Chlamydia psittaci]
MKQQDGRRAKREGRQERANQGEGPRRRGGERGEEREATRHRDNAAEGSAQQGERGGEEKRGGGPGGEDSPGGKRGGEGGKKELPEEELECKSLPGTRSG